jgi:hypothetical protein
MADPRKSFLEKTGFGLTLLCGIHCLATPILLSAMPLAGQKVAFLHTYEPYIMYGSMLLAFVLLRKDYRSHKNVLPLQLVLAALVVRLVFDLTALKPFELLFTILIAGLLIGAYWQNWQHKAKCTCHKPV